MTIVDLSPHPAYDRATAPPEGSIEADFIAFMIGLGYIVEYEPDTFPCFMRQRVGGRLRRRRKAFTPDVKVVGHERVVFDQPVYIELTAADLYVRPDQLPAAIRAKNRRSSASRQEHITPEEYLARKSAKIRAAITGHPSLVVALLTAAEQKKYFSDPSALHYLIHRLTRTHISCVG